MARAQRGGVLCLDRARNKNATYRGEQATAEHEPLMQETLRD
jgi:hypothetical protein